MRRILDVFFGGKLVDYVKNLPLEIIEVKLMIYDQIAVSRTFKIDGMCCQKLDLDANIYESNLNADFIEFKS